MRQRTEAVQAAAATIADQVLVLKGFQASMEFEQEIADLESIIAAANTEQAAKTAELVRGIVAARQKAFQEKATQLGIPIRARRRGPGGPDFGGPGGMRDGGEPPIPGGFEWID